MNQLFIISDEALNACSLDTIRATCDALKELGLYELPYPSVDVQMSADAVCRVESGDIFGPGGIITIHDISLAKHTTPQIIFTWTTNPKWPGKNITQLCLHNSEEIRIGTAELLITLLASKNAIKITTKNKLAALGIGKSRGRHIYTTTITVPRDLDHDTEHKPTGTKRCPHLRRGHIRHQHYGPNGQFIKQIWIAPVFVNADENFVSTRKAYNLGITPGASP